MKQSSFFYLIIWVFALSRNLGQSCAWEHGGCRGHRGRRGKLVQTSLVFAQHVHKERERERERERACICSWSIGLGLEDYWIFIPVSQWEHMVKSLRRRQSMCTAYGVRGDLPSPTRTPEHPSRSRGPSYLMCHQLLLHLAPDAFRPTGGATPRVLGRQLPLPPPPPPPRGLRPTVSCQRCRPQASMGA